MEKDEVQTLSIERFDLGLEGCDTTSLSAVRQFLEGKGYQASPSDVLLASELLYSSPSLKAFSEIVLVYGAEGKYYATQVYPDVPDKLKNLLAQFMDYFRGGSLFMVKFNQV